MEQRDIILVAHNGNHFDIPFLLKSFDIHGIVAAGLPFKGQIDTLSLAKFSITAMIRLGTRRLNEVPGNYHLGTLYQL